jgi:Spy/CpxP family protein refolding chaperone
MRHWTGWLLGLGAAAALAAPALAVEEVAGEAPAKAKSALRGEYAIMASECQFTDAQKAQLEVAVTAKIDSSWTWGGVNRAKIVDLEKQMADAKEKGDKEAQKRVGEEMKALKEQLHALKFEHNAKIAAILTPEQCQVWEGFKLYRALMGRYSKAELDEGQKAKVRVLANEAAKKMLAVTGAGKEAEEAKDKIEKDLEASVENDVLTAEQKEKLNAPKAPKEKAEERAPKEEAPKTGAEGAKEGPAEM